MISKASPLGDVNRIRPEEPLLLTSPRGFSFSWSKSWRVRTKNWTLSIYNKGS